MDQSISVAQLVNASNNALSVIKNVGNKLKKTKRSDALSDVLDIQSAMMEVQEKQQRLINENMDLRGRVKELEEGLKFNGELVRDGNYLYLKTDRNRTEPYCLACWGHDRRLIGVIVMRQASGPDIFQCNICTKRGEAVRSL
jgi:hypothetical protein